MCKKMRLTAIAFAILTLTACGSSGGGRSEPKRINPTDSIVKVRNVDDKNKQELNKDKETRPTKKDVDNHSTIKPINPAPIIKPNLPVPYERVEKPKVISQPIPTNTHSREVTRTVSCSEFYCLRDRVLDDIETDKAKNSIFYTNLMKSGQYIYGYGLNFVGEDLNKNLTLNHITSDSKNLLIDGKPVVVGKMIDKNNATALDLINAVNSNGNFLIDYDGQGYLGRINKEIVAFGQFKNTPYQINSEKFSKELLNYYGTALINYNDKDYIGGFTGKFYQNQFIGNIVVPLENDKTAYNTLNIDFSTNKYSKTNPVFAGKFKAYKYYDEQEHKWSSIGDVVVTLNGNKGKTAIGILNSKEIHGGFIGGHDEVIDREDREGSYILPPK